MENNESSSSTPSSSKKPQVFLSFRGMDTRTNFTNHLYDALQPKGYEIFMDSESLKRGKDIAPELIAAIEASQFAIVVFSKNYAFSKWCLKELAKILDCRRNRGLAVYPVFYHVDPADLRKLRGEFVGEAFIKHKTADLHPMDMETVESWQKAVTQLADIAGRHVLEYTYVSTTSTLYSLSLFFFFGIFFFPLTSTVFVFNFFNRYRKHVYLVIIRCCFLFLKITYILKRKCLVTIVFYFYFYFKKKKENIIFGNYIS